MVSNVGKGSSEKETNNAHSEYGLGGRRKKLPKVGYDELTKEFDVKQKMFHIYVDSCQCEISLCFQERKIRMFLSAPTKVVISAMIFAITALY